ncbi:site-specific integrase [Pseudalkalibacillus caeni]|uniref:site-specific integrase n=1 Tax=Exobacillus caeni TaxID=2574798 RepID=UPI001485B8BC|nr:site-specific integrase [Pseudalkalibacillus caeni]
MFQLIGEYLDSLEIEKGLSYGTLANYKSKLKALANYLSVYENIDQWDGVTFPHLRNYLKYLKEDQNKSASSRANSVSCF